MMKHLHFTLLLLAALLLAGCSTVPLTGRKQMLLVSDSEVLSSSLTQYNDYIKSAKKSVGRKRRVCTRVYEHTPQRCHPYRRYPERTAGHQGEIWQMMNIYYLTIYNLRFTIYPLILFCTLRIEMK